MYMSMVAVSDTQVLLEFVKFKCLRETDIQTNRQTHRRTDRQTNENLHKTETVYFRTENNYISNQLFLTFMKFQ